MKELLEQLVKVSEAFEDQFKPASRSDVLKRLTNPRSNIFALTSIHSGDIEVEHEDWEDPKLREITKATVDVLVNGAEALIKLLKGEDIAIKKSQSIKDMGETLYGFLHCEYSLQTINKSLEDEVSFFYTNMSKEVAVKVNKLLYMITKSIEKVPGLMKRGLGDTQTDENVVDTFEKILSALVV